MRTTVEIQDGLFRQAKKVAAERGVTLASVIDEALRHFLRPKIKTDKVPKLIIRNDDTVSSIDFSSRDAIEEALFRLEKEK